MIYKKILVAFWGTALLCSSLTGCTSTEGNLALGVIGATAYGGGSPSNELEQTYYIGVFDPTEQLPPTFYRIRVHGQASFLSGIKFASGWVRADLIDSLGSGIVFDKNSGSFKVSSASPTAPATFLTGRRLVLFGPEGFREAPKDHRLVIVMGTSPEKYFTAMDSALGQVSNVFFEQRNMELSSELFKALTSLSAEKNNLAELEKDIIIELADPYGEK